MNLHTLLLQRQSRNSPLRVGLIGAGKFGSMYLSQIPRTPGVHLVGIADLLPGRARQSLLHVGWPAEQIDTSSLTHARIHGRTFIGDDSLALISSPEIEIVIDATGNPAAGIDHVLACCEHGKHIIMVNVEADALAGPLLAHKARSAGIIYSLAYGDQPALICEMVDWARASGFEVVAAGKGTKYLPAFHRSTPDDVWQHYGISNKEAKAGGMNPQMFNSFLDGSKSAIEMAAVANATGLQAPSDGLTFPACGVDDLPTLFRPRADGGMLESRGQVEVVSSLERDTRSVFRDLRWGVFVCFAADTDYVRRCFSEYGLLTDKSGNYSAMYKPYHLIGLELGMSVASIGLRREPTGQAGSWNADVIAVAKRALRVGEVLDGEGGYCVFGKLMPASASTTLGGLPLGLAHGVRLGKPVAAGAAVLYSDVELDEQNKAVRFRREMEKTMSDCPVTG